MQKVQRHSAADKLIAVFLMLATILIEPSHGNQPYQSTINGVRSDAIRFPEDEPTPFATRNFHDGNDGGRSSSSAPYQTPNRSPFPQRLNELQSPAIPLNITRRLNSISSLEELYDLLEPDPSTGLISPRFGHEDVERSLGKRARPAYCIATDTVVPLQLLDNTDPSITLFPSCTRVKRCGGCCGDLQSCQPTATQSITFQVQTLRYNGATGKLVPVGREPVIVEEHTACKCDCRTKANHCNGMQRYNKQDCTCDCINSDDHRKCSDDSTKLWNPGKCQCQCREIFECTTGSYFDYQQCRCNQNHHEAPIIRDTHPEERKRLYLRPTYLTEAPDTQYNSGN